MQIIRGIKPRARRILLYGVHGCGKSTWASQAPKPFFVNLEDGVDDIDCDKSPMLQSFYEFMAALDWLLVNQHDYQTIVIDTIDWLDMLIKREVCKEAGAESLNEVGGGFGKGNSRVLSKWDLVLQKLIAMQKKRGVGLILIGHAKVEKVKPADQDAYDKYAPDVGIDTSMMLQEWCDDVLFAQFKIYVAQIEDGIKKTRGRASGGKDVVLRTGETVYAYAKNRVSGMPSELPMQWQAYYECVKSHYAKVKRGDIEAIVVDGSSEVVTDDILQVEKDAMEVF